MALSLSPPLFHRILLPYPLLRDESDFQQIDYRRLERDWNAERHQVRGDQIAEVQDQLEKHTYKENNINIDLLQFTRD